MRTYWSIGAISVRFCEGNINSKKYVSILENNISKIKEILPKIEIAMR